MVSGPKPVQIVSSVSVKNVKIAGTMLFTWVSTVGTRMICSETGRRHLSLAAHSTMPIENRFYLEEAECQQFDEFIRDLLHTVGTVSVILDCAASTTPRQQARFLHLARETSARGTRTLKKVLWQWADLRKDFAEENTTRTPEALTETPKAEIVRQIFNPLLNNSLDKN